MADVALVFEVEGDKEVAAVLEGVGNRAGNLRTPMNAIGKYMRSEIDDNFRSRGGLWGKWKRRKKSYPHPLLEATGRMRGGFWQQTASDSVTLGNDEKYFKYHQSKKPRSSNLPRRVMMAVAEEQRREIVRTLQRHLMEKR